MKILVVITSLLAISNASYYGGKVGDSHENTGLHQHVPVIGPYGVPLETPEVTAAKKEHLLAHSAAKSYQSFKQEIGKYEKDEHKKVYHGPIHIPVIGKDGVPHDTHEVVKAREAHLKALSEAKSHGYEIDSYSHEGNTGDSQKDAHHQQIYRGPIHIPVIGKDGVPLDTHDVEKARKEHLKALSEAKYRGSHSTKQVLEGYHLDSHQQKVYHGPIHIPVIGKDGVPYDTHEVIKARKAHLKALDKAKSQECEIDAYSDEQGNEENTHHKHVYHGAIHIPVIGKDGVPHNTHEVENARSEHLKALHEASAHRYYSNEHHFRGRRSIPESKVSIHTPNAIEKTHVYHGHHYGSPWAHDLPVIKHDGQPHETPEVVAWKHHHIAAHQEAISRLHKDASAHHENSEKYYASAWTHQYPVIGHDGKPQETPEVLALKHSHFAAHQKLKTGLKAIASSGQEDSNKSEHLQFYHGPIHIPKIGKDGVPHDTPEVVAARAAHLKALHVAASKKSEDSLHRIRRSGKSEVVIHTPNALEKTYIIHGENYGTPWAHEYPIIGHDGKPLETKDVVAWKHHHFAAHEIAKSRLEDELSKHHETGEMKQYASAWTYPSIGHDGKPLETPEVVALKHAHFAAHHEAKSKLHEQDSVYSGQEHEDSKDNGHHQHVYHGPIHIPVIDKNGVPYDTPEVKAARSAHLKVLHNAASQHQSHHKHSQ